MQWRHKAPVHSRRRRTDAKLIFWPKSLSEFDHHCTLLQRSQQTVTSGIFFWSKSKWSWLFTKRITAFRLQLQETLLPVLLFFFSQWHTCIQYLQTPLFGEIYVNVTIQRWHVHGMYVVGQKWYINQTSPDEIWINLFIN